MLIKADFRAAKNFNLNTISKDLLRELLAAKSRTCLSLYMPMHRSHPENLQDPIRFKNLLKQLEESLLQEYSTIETKQLLDLKKKQVRKSYDEIVNALLKEDSSISSLYGKYNLSSWSKKDRLDL